MTTSDATADVIITDPAHRRRGLGRAVMGALVAASLEQSAAEGLLVASEDGVRLYRALGWWVVAEIVIARSRQGIGGTDRIGTHRPVGCSRATVTACPRSARRHGR